MNGVQHDTDCICMKCLNEKLSKNTLYKEVDTRLADAAPELLDALEFARNIIWKQMDERIPMIEKAIAKAKGGQS